MFRISNNERKKYHYQLAEVYDHQMDEEYDYIIMKQYSMNLMQFKNKYAFNKYAVFTLLNQLIDAVIHLNNNNLFHPDLKMENVLMDEDYNAYMCDFDDLVFLDCVQTTKFVDNFILPDDFTSKLLTEDIKTYCLLVSMYQINLIVTNLNIDEIDKELEHMLSMLKSAYTNEVMIDKIKTDLYNYI